MSSKTTSEEEGQEGKDGQTSVHAPLRKHSHVREVPRTCRSCRKVIVSPEHTKAFFLFVERH